jgi:hypothetical protein
MLTSGSTTEPDTSTSTLPWPEPERPPFPEYGSLDSVLDPPSHFGFDESFVGSYEQASPLHFNLEEESGTAGRVTDEDFLSDVIPPFQGMSSQLVDMQRTGTTPMLATPNCELESLKA